LFFCLFSLVYIPSLLLRGKFHRGFIERFGFIPKELGSLKRPVWIHAVSVGEALVAVKLARAIKKVFPDASVVVSTTTRTGNEMIRRCAEGSIDAFFYYPLDMSFIVRRVVRLLEPRLYVMVETELWPNILVELSKRGIAAVLVNGRISDKSFAGYRKIKFITRRILKNIDSFLMQSPRDAERIRDMGASAGKISVTGSMKFDEAAPSFSERDLINREKLGFTGGDKIIVAGSTHHPEETIVVDIYRSLREKMAGLKLILAPRHIERIGEIKSFVEGKGLAVCGLSEMLKGGEAASGKCDVLLVDTIGHLKDLYSVASIVFIGGSLARKGGQNPIEAARWQKPIVFGPHMSNFREVSEVFLEHSAAVEVRDSSHLKEVCEKVLKDPAESERLAKAAGKVIESNSGAVDKTVERIKKYINP